MPFASLWQLYLARLREFYRQPARMFWVYGFPIVLAIGLGLAFRSRPPEPVQVTVVAAPADLRLFETLTSKEARQGRAGHPGIRAESATADEAARRLRTGKTPLVVAAEDSGVRFTFDPTRPDAGAVRGRR